MPHIPFILGIFWYVALRIALEGGAHGGGRGGVFWWM